MLKDLDVQIRWHAVKALADLGALRAVPELRRVAAEDEGGFSITPTSRVVMRDEALRAIQQIESGRKQ